MVVARSAPATIESMNPKDPVRASFEEASSVLAAFLADPTCLENVRRFAQSASKALEAGGQLLSCGNGGSMCDAMHFAEEWTGRFRRDRSAVPAIAFSDPSQITCIANDFGYDEIFARSVEAYGKKGDLLVVLSTSGDSKNILRAIEVAKTKGSRAWASSGRAEGGRKASSTSRSSSRSRQPPTASRRSTSRSSTS